MTSFTVNNLYFYPPSGITFQAPGQPPNYISIPGGIAPNAQYCTTVTITSTGPVQFCFDVSIHDKDFLRCCTRQHCIALPERNPSGKTTSEPDGISLTDTFPKPTVRLVPSANVIASDYLWDSPRLLPTGRTASPKAMTLPLSPAALNSLIFSAADYSLFY